MNRLLAGEHVCLTVYLPVCLFIQLCQFESKLAKRWAYPAVHMQSYVGWSDNAENHAKQTHRHTRTQTHNQETHMRIYGVHLYDALNDWQRPIIIIYLYYFVDY